MIHNQTKIYWEVIQEPTQTGAVRVVESPGPGGEQPNVCLVNYDKFCRAGSLEQRIATRLQTAKLIAAAPQMLEIIKEILGYIGQFPASREKRIKYKIEDVIQKIEK